MYCHKNNDICIIYFVEIILLCNQYIFIFLFDKSRGVLENLFADINRRFDMEMISGKMGKEITESCLLAPIFPLLRCKYLYYLRVFMQVAVLAIHGCASVTRIFPVQYKY